MSKKTKRSKKGRKGSSFDSSSRKRGRDEVTELYWDWEGLVRLHSDKVNSISFQQARDHSITNGYGTSNERDWAHKFPLQIEAELSSDAVVITQRDAGGNNIDRTLLKGEFNYSGGRLESFLLRDSITYSVFNATEDPEIYASGWSYSGGITVRNADRFLLDESAINTAQRVGEFSSSSRGNYGDNSFISQLDTGVLFSGGWWQDPFAPNLI